MLLAGLCLQIILQKLRIMNPLRRAGKEMLAAVLAVLSWLHSLVMPIGEWISVNVLDAFEEITKVRTIENIIFFTFSGFKS